MLVLKGLPTRVIVGLAVIQKVTKQDDGLFGWHLTGVRRAKRRQRPFGQSQPMWFTPCTVD